MLRSSDAELDTSLAGKRVALGRWPERADGTDDVCAADRRGIKAKPPRHRRAAPRYVDLAGLGAPFGLRGDVAGIKLCRSTVGSTHRGPSMALGALPPAKVLSDAVKDRREQGCQDRKHCEDDLEWCHVEVSVMNMLRHPIDHTNRRSQMHALFHKAEAVRVQSIFLLNTGS